MSAATRRRFPYAPGPLGWVGAAFLIVALPCQLAAVILLMWFVLKRDGRVVVPMIGIFLLSFLLLGVTMMLWRVAWKRAGTLRSSSVPSEQRKALIRTILAMNVAALLGLAGFVYLALRLDGMRRFAVAMVPLTLTSIASHAGLVKIREIQGRPGPSILGWTPRHEVVVFGVFSLVGSAFLLLAGLFWIPK